jgi:hypothetical protein
MLRNRNQNPDTRLLYDDRGKGLDRLGGAAPGTHDIPRPKLGPSTRLLRDSPASGTRKPSTTSHKLLKAKSSLLKRKLAPEEENTGGNSLFGKLRRILSNARSQSYDRDLQRQRCKFLKRHG